MLRARDPVTASPRPAISRPRVPVAVTSPRPAFTKLSPDGDYVYEYVYEYEDEYDQAPALVDNIGDYDLNPIKNKVRKHKVRFFKSFLSINNVKFSGGSS